MSPYFPIEILRVKCDPPEADPKYDGAESRTIVLPKGHQKQPDYAAFGTDTIFEKDIKIPLRDGTVIRVDIFRPAGVTEKVPILIAWSPYGKSGRGRFTLDLVPGRAGVPRSKNSDYEKIEALDPADWVARGYAVANVDTRGAWDSEGDIVCWCSQEGRDGYDVVEELANFGWCNGKIALMGNSWLAVAQWFIAAERPPHLACIAPFEGASDVYREIVARGGVPTTAFMGFLANVLLGRGTQEDIVGMIKKYPNMNSYWEDKRARCDQINVPVYALASYSTGLHTFGSFRGFCEANTDKKWQVINIRWARLRVHATQEWHDLYLKETNDELQKFFDRYTKDIENGWEMTPKVRVSMYRYNKEPIVNLPFSTWPIPETKYETLYLHGNGSLQTRPPASSETAVTAYTSHTPFMQMDADENEISFSYTFDKPAYLIGSARAKVYMSCPDHNDMDVWVQLRKADASGKLLHQITIPACDSGLNDEEVEMQNCLQYLGPSGALRASYRTIDPELSTPEFPEHNYYQKQLIEPGQIVLLEIGMWQTGMAFEKGEKLVFKISGHPMTLAEFPVLRGIEQQANQGTHRVHSGGETKSCVVIPLVEL
ncbi:hypothetical protein FE257_006730 [Aspergillus nanangensis]|uniref:Xaa-Pro dipeptidyl-peptidase C-terminal domain-containing protein n=1 Tax=Aspergillus nanangensis TaxID=2582783 RepID=A0AAD4GUV7_ASPNN|nr:hypothetical protein FE257_006730 [Aspergillus nanangensis]